MNPDVRRVLETAPGGFLGPRRTHRPFVSQPTVSASRCDVSYRNWESRGDAFLPLGCALPAIASATYGARPYVL